MLCWYCYNRFPLVTLLLLFITSSPNGPPSSSSRSSRVTLTHTNDRESCCRGPGLSSTSSGRHGLNAAERVWSRCCQRPERASRRKSVRARRDDWPSDEQLSRESDSGQSTTVSTLDNVVGHHSADADILIVPLATDRSSLSVSSSLCEHDLFDGVDCV